MAKAYPREFKFETVKLSYQTDKQLGELASDLGISRSSLSRWRQEYGEDPKQAFPGKGQQKERDIEIARLKKELREAQLENEILKKAVAITSTPLSTGFTHPKR
jgi:transposase